VVQLEFFGPRIVWRIVSCCSHEDQEQEGTGEILGGKSQESVKANQPETTPEENNHRECQPGGRGDRKRSDQRLSSALIFQSLASLDSKSYIIAQHRFSALMPRQSCFTVAHLLPLWPATSKKPGLEAVAGKSALVSQT
jgi:hypothetical protein